MPSACVLLLQSNLLALAIASSGLWVPRMSAGPEMLRQQRLVLQETPSIQPGFGSGRNAGTTLWGKGLRLSLGSG